MLGHNQWEVHIGYAKKGIYYIVKHLNPNLVEDATVL